MAQNPLLNILGLSPIQQFNMMAQQEMAAPRPAASITATSPQTTAAPVTRGQPPAIMRMPQPQADAIQQASLASRAMRSPMMAAPMERGPQTPPTFMERLQGLDDPTLAGMGAAGASLLRATGYSAVPRTTGEIFGQALSEYNRAVAKAKAEVPKPEIKVAGDQVYRIYPDGRVDLLSGTKAAKPAEVKGEAGRMQMPDGRITQGVYDKQGNLYEIGNLQEKIDPKQVKFIDQFTSQSVQQLQQFKKDEIKPKEKTLKYIDTLADQINRSPSGWAERQRAKLTTAIKRFAGRTDYTEEELMMALSRGTLTALVGASRLELFGPGVLTEAEAELARQVFVGEFDGLNRTEALARLKSFRDMTFEGYIEDIGVYNTSPATTKKYEPYFERSKPIFDWEKQYGAEADVSVSRSSKSSQSGSTSGGNTWTVQ